MTLALIEITADAIPLAERDSGPSTAGLTVVAVIDDASGQARYFNPVGGKPWFSRAGDYECREVLPTDLELW